MFFVLFHVTCACNEIFKSRVLAGIIVMSRTVPTTISTSELPVQDWQETEKKKKETVKHEQDVVEPYKFQTIKSV